LLRLDLARGCSEIGHRLDLHVTVLELPLVILLQQEELRIVADDQTGAAVLDQIAGLIDWSEIDRQLVNIYAAPKGEQGWPPLALFRAMLLAVWHDLSDVKLAEAVADRASFRRFCGLSTSEPTPERTAFVRFRAELVGRGLDRTLFDDHPGTRGQRRRSAHRDAGGRDADCVREHSP
jgi:hypothetical protein